MARILDLMKGNEKKNPERKGIFTTGILAKASDNQAALFFTGRQHAGENLNDLLDKRNEALSAPIQACDAASRNLPKDHLTQPSLCNSHARRGFYEIVSCWPKECLNVVSLFDLVFLNDRIAKKEKLTPEVTLEWHQKRSAPLMHRIKSYWDELLDTKQVEPNSSLGVGGRFMKKTRAFRSKISDVILC